MSAAGIVWKTNEAVTVKNAQKGSPEAFALLYSNYRDYIYKRCVYLTRDPFAAEDLTQEVFMQVWKKISSFQGRSSFKTWITRVATNIVFMQFRRNKRAPIPIDDVLPNVEWLLESERSSPRILNQRIYAMQGISRLPHKARTVLVLHDLNGYKHREIAKILGITCGTSKSQLHKARSRMRTFFRRLPAVIHDEEPAWDRCA